MQRPAPLEVPRIPTTHRAALRRRGTTVRHQRTLLVPPAMSARTQALLRRQLTPTTTKRTARRTRSVSLHKEGLRSDSRALPRTRTQTHLHPELRHPVRRRAIPLASLSSPKQTVSQSKIISSKPVIPLASPQMPRPWQQTRLAWAAALPNPQRLQETLTLQIVASNTHQ